LAAQTKITATLPDFPFPTRLVTELAESAALREFAPWFARERQWIHEQHLQLCRIPAATFFEQKRAEWMAAQLRALGWESRLDRAGNTIAHLPGRQDGPFVALTAHLDTVLAPRQPEEISLGTDRRLHGPGVSDNGAGLAALLALAKAIRAPQFEKIFDAGAPLLIANVGEEGEGNLSGMRFLCRQSPLAGKIRTFVVLDGPSINHITCQALASRRFEVAFSGPGGHSWSDYGIGNPVHAVARVIAQFADKVANAAAGARTSFNFGILEGGLSINSIPTHARAKLDIRSESAARLEELSALLTSCVERALEVENSASNGVRISAKVREIGSRPGGRMNDDSPLLQTIRAADAYLGIRSHLDCSSTDANIPLSLGLPAISIGAGGQGGGAHTPQEWFHAEGRELGLKRILLVMALLLREPKLASLEA